MLKFSSKNKYTSGMTLIELIVVISIMAILSGISIFSYSTFNSHTTTQNLSDDIALSIRKAQGYAIGARSLNSIFTYGYGVHFTTNTQSNNSNAGSIKSFILFTDIKENKIYNHSSGDNTCGSPSVTNECLEILNITSQDQISEIKYKIQNHLYTLNNDENLDIVFKRPNSEPTLSCFNNSGNSCKNGTISYVQIIVSSIKNQNVLRTITIFNNGQIGVN